MLINHGSAEQLFYDFQKKLKKGKVDNKEYADYYKVLKSYLNQEISKGGSSLIKNMEKGMITEQETDFLTKLAVYNLYRSCMGYKEIQVKYWTNTFRDCIEAIEPDTGKLWEIYAKKAYEYTFNFKNSFSLFAISLLLFHIVILTISIISISV